MGPLCLVAAVALTQLDPADAGARLEIEVRSMGNREPLPLARVEWPDGGLAGEADLDGKLALDLQPGPITVKVMSTGFVAQSFNESLDPGQRLAVIYRLDPSGVRPFETKIHGNRFRTEVARVALSDTEVHDVAGTQGEPLRVVLLLPGVAPIASGLAYPVVRGAQPAATAFYLDDIRVPQLFHSLVGPAVVHPAMIERVDFFSGTPPARFGRLMSGAVEAQLGRPRAEGFTAQASVDLLNASALAEVAFPSTGTAVTLAGRYSYTGALGALIAKQLLPSDPPRTPVANFWDYQARVEQRLGTGRLRLLALGASDEVGATADSPNYASGLFISNFHRVDLRWVAPAAGGEYEVGATVGPEQLGVRGEEGGAKSFAFLLSRTIASARGRYRRAFGDTFRVEAGADLEWQSASVELLGRTEQATVPITDFREPHSTGVLAALWAQVGYSANGFTANLGLRADLYHLDPDVTLPAIAPRVELRRALGERFDVRVSAGLVNQPPTVLLNLPVTDLAGLRQGLQNGLQTEAGFTWRIIDGVTLDAAVFDHTLFRAVEYGLEQLLDSRRNLSDAQIGVPGRAYGAELTLRKEPVGRWFGWLSATLMRSERLQTVFVFDGAGEVVGPPVTRWVAFAFDQTLVLNATAGLRLPYNFQVGLSGHLHTGRPESGQVTSRALQAGFDPATGHPIWVPVQLDQVPRLPPFARLDVRVSKLWRFNEFTLEAYLDLLNATFSREVLGYQYTVGPGGTLAKVPFDVPLVLPQLGLKGVY